MSLDSEQRQEFERLNAEAKTLPLDKQHYFHKKAAEILVWDDRDGDFHDDKASVYLTAPLQRRNFLPRGVRRSFAAIRQARQVSSLNDPVGRV